PEERAFGEMCVQPGLLLINRDQVMSGRRNGIARIIDSVLTCEETDWIGRVPVRSAEKGSR
ncbi:MAG TPA: hypothetical protein VHA53_06425, partial [Nitrolancea sp.]|nr:hypothetical protein [Nitrolancea sp.]